MMGDSFNLSDCMPAYINYKRLPSEVDNAEKLLAWLSATTPGFDPSRIKALKSRVITDRK
jgi:hypothetical protein